MAVKIFAAIDVGSYELSMKIFEISGGKGIRALDYIRHRIDLGTESYNTGKLSYERVAELKRVLLDYKELMKSYGLQEYRAYATSALRETYNRYIVLNQIENMTGLHIDILSNSEQRFLDYKSIATKGSEFNEIIEKGTAIVDIGGGSIQISLFDKDTLVTTQNMRLGVLRIYDRIRNISTKPGHMEKLMEEMVSNQLAMFKKLYLKDREIKNLIIVDDYVSMLFQDKNCSSHKAGFISAPEYMELMESIKNSNYHEIAAQYGIPQENIPLLLLSGLLVQNAVGMFKAELIWAPGVTLCDGMAYEYAEKNKLISVAHNFEQDIIACAMSTSKRYLGSRKRNESIEEIALMIFDCMKKVHGLGKRERLYLQIASILHDCGKFISLSGVGESSYHIVMATEIIGLSHAEREMIANIVKYNHLEFAYFDEIGNETQLERNEYLTIAKLTAILRVANGIARSYQQKFTDFKAVLKESEILITVETTESMELEQGLFDKKAHFFEEVFHIRPVLRVKGR